ncbi:MAG: septum site-determining protein MinC [Zoogloeaceae bacterium]|jgi:septum site-determining protein MinC|nr:septum site-determining protein MinC [Zoogloeaceae bacterium]
MKKTKSAPLIEFKGSTVPAIVVTLRDLDPEALRQAAETLFGAENNANSGNFFDGDVGLLNLAPLAEVSAPPDVDWDAILTNFSRHGLKVIGVRGGSPALGDSAQAAGLTRFAADERRPAPVPQIVAPIHETASETAPEPAPEPVPEPAPKTPDFQNALLIDRPLRSGQQVYARGGDLVVLASVNPGAEVIADGSIHIYAPLRGRALAGASGNPQARIFTTCFEAELVSVAGIYRTFSDGVPAELKRRPALVKADADCDALLISPLKID